jgi:hypothetical protein
MKRSILKSAAFFTAAVILGGVTPVFASAQSGNSGDKMSLHADKTAVRPNETITVSVDITSSDETVSVFACGINLKGFTFVKNSVNYTYEPAMDGATAINDRLAIAAVNNRNTVIPSGKAIEFELQAPASEGVYSLSWYLGEVDGNRAVETAGITVKVSAFTGEFPCVLFGTDTGNSVRLNGQTANINGNIGTNGTFSTTASNQNINGAITENDYRDIKIIGERLAQQYFSGGNIQNIPEDYAVSNNNINIGNPIEVDGEISLDGNVSLNSALTASEDVVIDGGNVNGNNSLIYSENGDIKI